MHRGGAATVGMTYNVSLGAHMVIQDSAWGDGSDNNVAQGCIGTHMVMQGNVGGDDLVLPQFAGPTPCTVMEGKGIDSLTRSPPFCAAHLLGVVAHAGWGPGPGQHTGRRAGLLSQ